MNDIRALCRTRKTAQSPSRVLCANDRLKTKPISVETLANKRRKFAAKGYLDPTCFVCGENDLRTLELQHIAGKANSALVVPYCGNCHAIATDVQGDLPRWLLRGDPLRRPLMLEAAFDFGLAIVAGALCVDSRDSTATAFWALIAAALVGWAVWNIAADGEFARRFGPEYSATVPASVPE